MICSYQQRLVRSMFCAGNYRQPRRSRLNSRPSKHRIMLLAEDTLSRTVCNYKLGCLERTTSWDVVVTRPEG
eukprot:16445494-Heterocapsa_arctica.AAC.1